MAYKYKVTFSDYINQSDTVTFDEKTYTFKLHCLNDSGRKLILLYIYRLPKFVSHGVKVGMTTCNPNESFWAALKRRIEVQQHELALDKEEFDKYGQERDVLYWGVCLDAESEIFKDYRVHDALLKEYPGLVEKKQEWFRFNDVPDDVIIDTFERLRKPADAPTIYTPHKEQQDCIDALKRYFDKNPVGGRFLLNCKMRFGKSYTTYKYCEEAGINKILILTFVPAVEESWKEDLTHISKKYHYRTDRDLRREDYLPEGEEEPFVLFLSLQNFLGRDRATRETKKKIEKLKNVSFNLVILDEYHFGAWNQRTQRNFEKLEDLSDDETYQHSLKNAEDVVKKFGIRTKKTICLSGTPFKAIDRGEFDSSNSFTYTYFDEQKNKYPNDDFTHPDPDYAQFPDMKIFGYNMSKLFPNLVDKVYSDDKILGKRYFSLNKFFETERDNDPSLPCRFLYQDAIEEWLEILNGRSVWGANFPYSQPRMKQHNVNTLWLMPSVNACMAMAELLKNHYYFGRYEIINLSDPFVGSGTDALEYLNERLASVENTKKIGSIAITVNKLTLGVTVKQWSSVFVLKDLASPEQYFQSIFRIQTPWVINDVIQKRDGYVYDFNIDRAAALLISYAKESADEQYTKLEIAKLIVKYLPIYQDGNMESPIDYEVLYQLAEFGDMNKEPLSRRFSNIQFTTNMYDDAIVAQMLNDDQIPEIIKKVFSHSKLARSKKRDVPAAPEDNGFKSEEAKKGRDLGYELGMKDSHNYVDLDDEKLQEVYETTRDNYVDLYTPSDYNEEQKKHFANGFRRGYDTGVNSPIKRQKLGKADGEKFAKEIIKKVFGLDIQYTKDTRSCINDFVNKYLNDVVHIPEQYRGKLYQRWYKESFVEAVRATLRPTIVSTGDNPSIEDTEEVLRHILSRLVEFLYISVYRETTFREIFKNADPDVFLEAVGITKEEFETINKYHIFEENNLNNYIHQFFVNESIGEDIDKDGPDWDAYRNSFGWFGFHDLEETVNTYEEEVLKKSENK